MTAELRKYLARKQEIAHLQEFLVWLHNDKGLDLCEYHDSGSKYDSYYAETEKMDINLITEYLGIDLAIVEQEKQQLLDEQLARIEHELE